MLQILLQIRVFCASGHVPLLGTHSLRVDPVLHTDDLVSLFDHLDFLEGILSGDVGNMNLMTM